MRFMDEAKADGVRRCHAGQTAVATGTIVAGQQSLSQSDVTAKKKQRRYIHLTARAKADLPCLPIMFWAVFRTPRTPQQLPYRGTVK